jgi:hypothetical protein
VNEDDVDVMISQGGMVDEATEHLESIAPAGYHFEWDMGELSLVACEDIEGHGPERCEADE